MSPIWHFKSLKRQTNVCARPMWWLHIIEERGIKEEKGHKSFKRMVNKLEAQLGRTGFVYICHVEWMHPAKDWRKSVKKQTSKSELIGQKKHRLWCNLGIFPNGLLKGSNILANYPEAPKSICPDNFPAHNFPSEILFGEGRKKNQKLP